MLSTTTLITVFFKICTRTLSILLRTSYDELLITALTTVFYPGVLEKIAHWKHYSLFDPPSTLFLIKSQYQLLPAKQNKTKVLNNSLMAVSSLGFK